MQLPELLVRLAVSVDHPLGREAGRCRSHARGASRVSASASRRIADRFLEVRRVDVGRRIAADFGHGRTIARDTGQPAAWASMTGQPKPSSVDGNTRALHGCRAPGADRERRARRLGCPSRGTGQQVIRNVHVERRADEHERRRDRVEPVALAHSEAVRNISNTNVRFFRGRLDPTWRRYRSAEVIPISSSRPRACSSGSGEKSSLRPLCTVIAATAGQSACRGVHCECDRRRRRSGRPVRAQRRSVVGRPDPFG